MYAYVQAANMQLACMRNAPRVYGIYAKTDQDSHTDNWPCSCTTQVSRVKNLSSEIKSPTSASQQTLYLAKVVLIEECMQR